MLCLPVVLTGCALDPVSDPTPEPGVSIQGTVHGGQQPIVGARVYLLAANTTGYGGAGVAASSSNASVSLLSTGASDSIGGYVTSGAGGSFSISGDYSCTPNTQVYLYALGGDSGAGTNTASGLLAALGNCPSSGNFASATPFITMNEATTVAAAYAFAGFASDATHVSSSGTTAAKLGIKNAFANAANLVDLSTGVTRSTTPGGNGTVPTKLVNTLGDILASCINTNGAVNGPSNPTACYTLFQSAQSAGSSGTVPSDTATAAINIAHNPGANIASLYGLPTAQAPLAPQLSAQPNDFTVGIEFSGGGLNDPLALAIDGSGNVWAADGGGASAVSELSPAGLALSPAGGYVASSTSELNTNGIAIDPSGNVWLTAYYDGAIFKLSSAGAVLSGSGFTGGSLKNPLSIAIDGTGNAWATDFLTSSVAELSNTGTILSGTGGFTGSIKTPVGIALDGSGNAWIVNRDNDSLTKFSSNGTLLSGTGFTGGGLNKPYAVALDHSGNAWVASYGSLNSAVAEFSSAGSAVSPSSGYTAGGIDSPTSIAVDGAGQIWIANTGQKTPVSPNLIELSNSGTLISPDLGYRGGNVDHPLGVAVDLSGNVWTVNQFNSTVTQLIGAAAPTVTPLSVAVRDNTLGTKP